MKRISLIGATLIAFATPAAAQDFSGIRVEGRVMYDSISLDADYSDPLGTITTENDEDGFGFGIEAGYDFPVASSFIVGIYGGIDLSDADFCRTLSSFDEACLEVKRNIYVGARAGFQVGGSTLIYGKAGYSNGQAEFEFNDIDDLIPDAADSDSRDGWHFGLGVEQNFGSMFYGKLEWVRTMYGDLDFANPNFALTLDGGRSQIVAGFGLRF